MLNKAFVVLKSFVLIFMIMVFGFLSYLFIKKGITDYNVVTVNYSTEAPIDYKVYLFPNDFFEEEYLGMDRTYISSLIDYIDVTFKYNLSLDDLVESGKYNYYIRGTLSADKTNNKSGSYWSKSYDLTEKQEISYDGTNGFNILSNVKIDYQYYNSILKQFIKEYGVSINGIFNVELVVESVNDVKSLEQNIKVNSISALKIPLTSQVIDIALEKSNADDRNSISESAPAKDRLHDSLVFIGIILIVVVIVCVVFLVKEIKKVYVKNSKYTKALKKILSSYDGIIVNVKKLPNYKGLRAIEVSEFSELIDAHGEVRMPINYCEIKKDRLSIFVLVNNDMAWVYTLDSEKLEQEK